jgi:hypothetical protein
MQLRGPAKGTTTRAHEPTPGAPLPSGIIRRHVRWGAAITALGGLLFGYDTGVISGALLFIGKDFPGLTSFDKSPACPSSLWPTSSGRFPRPRTAASRRSNETSTFPRGAMTCTTAR